MQFYSCFMLAVDGNIVGNDTINVLRLSLEFKTTHII